MASADPRRNPVPSAELERRWKRVRDAMREAKLDALLVQGSNNYTGGGGYFRWFTGIPAVGTYPQTVIFPVDGAMTMVHHGDFNGEVKSDPSQAASFGIGRRVTTPSFPAIGYTSSYDAELAAREIRNAGHKRVALVGGFMMYHGFAGRVLELLSGMKLEDATGFVDEIKAVKSEQ